MGSGGGKMKYGESESRGVRESGDRIVRESENRRVGESDNWRMGTSGMLKGVSFKITGFSLDSCDAFLFEVFLSSNVELMVDVSSLASVYRRLRMRKG